MATVAKAMACPESGLEVRDRMWLKITIANAFIGMFLQAEDMSRPFDHYALKFLFFLAELSW